MVLPIRPELLVVSAYGAPQIDVPVRLNTNENPYSPPAELIADLVSTIGEVANTLNRYPERDFLDLRTALAQYLAKESGVELSPGEIWAANGSNEVMQQLLQTVGGPGRKAVAFSPTYSMYEEYCRNTHTEFVSLERLPDFTIDEESAKSQLRRIDPVVVFLTSPNNPTGTAVADLDLIDRLLQWAPRALIVVDEAYGEFRRVGVPSALTKFRTDERVVVVRTMSKAFAMAGLRLGYAAMSPELIEAVKRARLPYHLSSLTQAGALVALRHSDALQRDLAKLRSERDALVEWFRVNGFDTCESDTNFVLFGTFKDRHSVWQSLVDRGVLVREVGPAGWLRVTIGTQAENAAFKGALLEVKGEGL